MKTPVCTEKYSKSYEVRTCKGLSKSERRSVEALKRVSLEVKQGETFGLPGSNSTVMTTLIKFLTTLLISTRRDAWINGYHITREENKVRASVGCMLMGERGYIGKGS
jgi:ABC-type multidrug transport system ATPase subunit